MARTGSYSGVIGRDVKPRRTKKIRRNQIRKTPLNLLRPQALSLLVAIVAVVVLLLSGFK